MIIVILATMAALLLCTIFSAQSMKELQSKALDTMETDEREAYDEQIKQQVDNVISLCQTIYDQYQAGVYTEAEARNLRRMKSASFATEIRDISGWISMTEPMWYCWEVQQKVQTVWRPRMLTGTR